MPLPKSRQRILLDIVKSLRNRPQGIGVLFVGAGRQRKITAAEVIARQTGRDLFRVDLAAVLSKFIGETEKNLSRVFKDNEAKGALILFDEADALFGKRSEVKDAHDRFANIEINYLLQLIERHPGGVIFATGSSKNIVRAFLKRMRFTVVFD